MSTSDSSPRITHFVEMGFPLHIVRKAIKDHGDDGTDDEILLSILSHKAIEDLDHPSTGHSHSAINTLEFPQVEQDEESDISWSTDDDIEIESSIARNGTSTSRMAIEDLDHPSTGHSHSAINTQEFPQVEQDEESDISWSTDDDIEIESSIARNGTSTSRMNPAGDVTVTIADDDNMSEDIDSFDWSTEDEFEIDSQDSHNVASSTPSTFFVEMGFPAHIVNKVIAEYGDGGSNDKILESILSYVAIEDLPGDSTEHIRLDSDINSARFPQVGQAIVDLPSSSRNCYYKKKNKKARTHEYLNDNDERTFDRKSMIGFGVPGIQCPLFSRYIPSIATGPPFFYYENVALTPKGVWEVIKKCLYNIDPEFVDSMHFSAAFRKRGYIHNLPLDGRYQLIPEPPSTIHDAFPDSVPYWPSWDKRQKLTCILTCIGSAQLTKRIKETLDKNCKGNADPPLAIQKKVLEQCRKWNMIWVGKNTVAHLEPHEIEFLLGFPKDHTRGYSTTDRHRFLGNSFQIDTVAYHLSVLKKLYPGGIKVLSLFSGIGGAEVALHRLGIPLQVVVSVEKSEQCREILSRWWDHTDQRGVLLHVDDVTKVSNEMLEGWMSKYGNFDLVIGGSPCNNLAGINRSTRVGLEGEHSSLFYQFVRILKAVKLLHRH